MLSLLRLLKSPLFQLTAAAALVVGVVVPLAARVGAAPDSAEVEKSNGEFVVHEWGTFTSFAGSDGVKLEFRPLVDSDLPPFVLDRWRQAGIDALLSKRSQTALQRMETPVIYFYSDVEREVEVKVEFPQGLITEYFPPVESQYPPAFDTGKEAPAVPGVDWGRFRVIPNRQLTTHVADPRLASAVNRRVVDALPPYVHGDSHYLPARETDSAMVYVHRPADPQRPGTPQGDFFERFLFYRGIGNFDLPLAVEARGGGKLTAANTGPNALRSLFLVNVEGKTVRFERIEQIDPGQSITIDVAALAGDADELAEALVDALVEERLYEKEARAMVATWRSSWFGEEGTRLFYTLPAAVTEELLPLQISPKPDELVRVLVGRLEVMTPEDEERMARVVRRNANKRASVARRTKGKSADPANTPVPLPRDILKIGRLAEPMLARVKATAADATVREEADRLLEQLAATRLD